MGILLLIFVSIHVAAPLDAPVVATPVKVADASCAQCHRQIYSSYLQTPMANASGPAAERFTLGTWEHKLSQTTYTFSKSGGQPVLSWRDLRNPQASGQWNLTYFLGSGHLGTTWLYSIDHYLFESPVAWYTASHRFDMKPGLADATQTLPALPMQSDCLRCHMSAVQPSDPGSLNRYSGLAFLHAGITCEACHGDTRRHVLSGGTAPVVNPATLGPEQRDSVCISCHLEGDASVQRAGHSILDYRPGQSISDYLAYYVYAKSDPMARGVSEVEQLSQSMCKRMSGDKMSCMSCHDPHFTPTASERVAFYRAKCLVCHNSPAFVKTHHPENPDCIGCHMPHNGAENIPHVAWTDHRILRNPPPLTSVPPSVTNVLEPVFSPGANTRDLGMAWYLAWLDGNRAAEAQAWSILQSQKSAIQNDKAALDALALLSVEHGENPQGEADFRQVLRLDPLDLTALSNLGILVAREGDLAESVQLLRRAFDRNQDVAGLAMNLARVQCMTGDAAGVRATLQSALTYNPGVAEIQQLLAHADACRVSAQQGTTP